MKTVFSFALAVIVFVFCASIASAKPQIRTAVINVTDDPALSQYAEIAASNFTGALAKSEAFTLSEREELALVLREQRINASQLGNPETAGIIGRLMRCDYILMCSLAYEASPSVSVRAVEVSSSKIVFSATEIADGADTSSINAASLRLADDVLKVFAGENAVITETGADEVTINRGSSSGVRKGDLYRVYIGTKRNAVNIAVIRVKDVRMGFSSAEIVKNGGYISVLRKSDRVEAVSKKEAASLTRRKFARNRPGEKQGEELAFASVNKLLEPLKMLSNDLFPRLQTSLDILVKQLPPNFDLSETPGSLKKYDTGKLLQLGEGFFEIGQEIDKAKKSILFDTEHLIRMYNEFSVFGDFSEEDFAKILDAISNTLSAVAVPFLSTAAERGDAEAQNNLGVMYYLGYVHVYDIALKYESNKETISNPIEVIAMLATLRPDYAKAAELFRKASKQGHDEAQNSLGTMYRDGLGVKQDYGKALELFTQSAAKGNANAQSNLGNMYFTGSGAAKDYRKAEDFYRKSAAQNNAHAQNMLGYMYLGGLGVKQNYAKALELFTQSAGQNYPTAYRNIAYMHLNGLGVPKNVRKAIELLRKAARLGDEASKKMLHQLGAN